MHSNNKRGHICVECSIRMITTPNVESCDHCIRQFQLTLAKVAQVDINLPTEQYKLEVAGIFKEYLDKDGD